MPGTVISNENILIFLTLEELKICSVPFLDSFWSSVLSYFSTGRILHFLNPFNSLS